MSSPGYLKGVAATIIGDEDEAIYRLMAAKDTCPKTVLLRLANERLAELKKNT